MGAGNGRNIIVFTCALVLGLGIQVSSREGEKR